MTFYIIAHKVRGQPAFDFAQPMVVGDETWWIIPTSGHRAYPYWTHEFDTPPPPMPEGLRDHYQTFNKLPTEYKTDDIDLEELGLL